MAPVEGPVVDVRFAIDVHGPEELVALWMVQLISLRELSVQVKLAMVP